MFSGDEYKHPKISICIPDELAKILQSLQRAFKFT